MNEDNSSKFMIGLLFGVLVGIAIWYYQKSTSAEDGALALLDRLAAAERRLKQLRPDAAQPVGPSRITLPSTPKPAPPSQPQGDDLQQVHGIGPVFDRRLQQAGIRTIARLAAMGPGELEGILEISRRRAETILAEARKLAG